MRKNNKKGWKITEVLKVFGAIPKKHTKTDPNELIPPEDLRVLFKKVFSAIPFEEWIERTPKELRNEVSTNNGLFMQADVVAVLQVPFGIAKLSYYLTTIGWTEYRSWPHEVEKGKKNARIILPKNNPWLRYDINRKVVLFTEEGVRELYRRLFQEGDMTQITPNFLFRGDPWFCIR